MKNHLGITIISHYPLIQNFEGKHDFACVHWRSDILTSILVAIFYYEVEIVFEISWTTLSIFCWQHSRPCLFSLHPFYEPNHMRARYVSKCGHSTNDHVL